MSALQAFQKFAGKSITIPGEMGPIFLYVLADDDLDEDGRTEVVENLHPQGALEEGWQLVAIEGEVEDGEADAGGFLCINEAENKAYLCDEGTIRFLDGAASALQIAIDES